MKKVPNLLFLVITLFVSCVNSLDSDTRSFKFLGQNNHGTFIKDSIIFFEPYGQFRYLRKLGEGQYGKVHLLLSLKDINQKVVVKEFLDDKIRRMNKNDLCEREANLLSLCDHTCIPKFYFANGNLMLMEYIPGLTLKQHVQEYLLESSMKRILFALNIGIKGFSILNYLHSEIGIVHHDIHSRNFIITDTDKLFLVDFGLAQQLDTLYNPSFSIRYNNHLRLNSQKQDVIHLIAMLRSIIKAENKEYTKDVSLELEEFLDTSRLEYFLYQKSDDFCYMEVLRDKLIKLIKYYESFFIY